MAKAEGKEFSFLDETHIRTDFLEFFYFNSPEQEIRIDYPEFSAVCPFSGLPDIALLTIKYYPTGGKCIELKSLKYYLVSIRNVGIYQEAVTKRISDELSAVLDTQVEVTTVYNTRGGFNTTCVENKLDDPSDMIRDLCE